MSKQFGIPIKYKNKLDLAKKFLDIYLAINPPKSNMHKRAKEALAYYLVYGYNKDVDIEDMFSDQISELYVRTVKTLLRKNGFLIKDERNHHKDHLSEEMKICSKELFKNNKRAFIIGFLQDV